MLIFWSDWFSISLVSETTLIISFRETHLSLVYARVTSCAPSAITELICFLCTYHVENVTHLMTHTWKKKKKQQIKAALHPCEAAPT